MIRIVNMSHARPGMDGRIRKQDFVVEGRRITPGATAGYDSLPSSAEPHIYHPDKNPHGMFDLVEVPVIAEAEKKEVVKNEEPTPSEDSESSPDAVAVESPEDQGDASSSETSGGDDSEDAPGAEDAESESADNADAEDGSSDDSDAVTGEEEPVVGETTSEVADAENEPVNAEGAGESADSKEQPSESKEMTAENAIAHIGTIDSLEKLQDFMSDGEKRKTVVDAYEKKFSDLS